MTKKKPMLTLKEYSEICGKPTNRLAALCAQGRIEGAMKVSKNWYVPADSPSNILDLRASSAAGLAFYTTAVGKTGSLTHDELKAKQRTMEAVVLFRNLGYTQTADRLMRVLEEAWD